MIKKAFDIFSVIWQACKRGVCPGALLRLSRHKQWFKRAGISTIIDVGANSGQFAFAIATILPKTQIYLFEPLPDCCEKLSKKIARYDQYRLFPVALGSERKETTFWANKFSPSSSVLPMCDLHKKIFPWTADDRPIIVRMQTLDDYFDKMDFKPHVLLKLDVQGYEHKVLSGGLKVLSHVDYVLVEVSFEPLYDGQASFHDIYQTLTSQGFEYAGNLDQLSVPGEESILQADALFIRKPKDK